MNDDIGQPAFVLQGHEDNAGGRTRPLATDDDAGGTDQGAMAGPAEFGRRQETPRGQPAAQQEQGVAAQAQAQGAVVGNQVFALTRRRQGQGCFLDRRMVEKIALHDAGRRRPGCLPAMPGQAQQGIGCRQPVEITTCQPGPGGEVGHIGKRGDTAGGRNPLGRHPWQTP